MIKKGLFIFLLLLLLTLAACSADLDQEGDKSESKITENNETAIPKSNENTKESQEKEKRPDPKKTLKDNFGYELTSNDFMTAVVFGQIDAVKIFLEEGMDPDTEVSIDYPVMYTAISNNQNTVITMLIEYGADVHRESKDGGNYIWFAVLNKAKNTTLDALLDGGVDINYTHSGDNSCDVALGQLKYDPEYQRLIDYLKEKGLKPNG